jgi:hypothetical protein
MSQKQKNPEPVPTQSAAMIILISMVSSGLLSKLIFPIFEMPGLVRMSLWIIWVLGTAFYLRQTGNGRVARNYLLVMFGIVIFIGLAIYFYNE